MAQLHSLRTRRSPCPIAFGLDLFGDKWTLLILRDIMFYKKTRFSDLVSDERIATNILTDRLSRLKQTGLITKKQDNNLRNQSIYSISDKGRALLPTLIEMSLWGMLHDAQTPISEHFKHRILHEHRQVTEEITNAIIQGVFEQYRESSMGVDLLNR